MLQLGDTFLLPKRANHTEHLWIVITRPDPETGAAVCVNVTTRQSYSESTVVLKIGDHPFITRESVVYYSDARRLNLRELEEALKGSHSFVCQQREPCGGALLQKIQEGLLASCLVKREIKEYCRSAWQK